jgi:hypothetical protein
MKRVWSVLAVVSALAGCATLPPRMLFQHPVTGAVKECPWIGDYGTDRGNQQQAMCAQTWLSSGYVRIE